MYGKKESSFTALQDVSFSVPDGSTVAIIGKSGSGKSTLMHIMSGLDHPDDGKVVISGRTLHELKRRDMDKFRSSEMGFIFQAFFVEGNQSVYQNVALPLEIAKTGRSQRKARVLTALQQVELDEKLNNKAKDLSGGQKQRLAIARAIVNRPKLIFADEPTGNLDSATGDKIIKLLFDLNKTLKCTLVVVTHDTDLAHMCQTQIYLKDGKVESIKTKGGAKSAANRGVA